jgi:glycosyltransferase involved in cell wall biosynthesis
MSAGDRLRIGVIAPPWFEVPPRAYGGIEWVCYWLTEGLIARGHDVTLVAAGPNRTSARFVRTIDQPPSARLGETLPELIHAARAAQALDATSIDVIHDHCLAGPLVGFGRPVPALVTAHGSVDGELADYYRVLPQHVSLVAISDAQRRIAPDLRWIGTVHNAIKVAEYPFQVEKDDYVLFLGRMGPEKGAHLAIDAAREAGWHAIVAGKCNEPREHAYFDDAVHPRLGPDAEYIGEADTKTKKELLARTRCLVFPIQWNEPFGLVMVEALACGTPVVALGGGSVGEVVEHDVTGYICDLASELPEAIKRADLIEPSDCRRRAETLFDVTAMVSGYEAVYRKALQSH